jgi:hypothetical protein
LAIRADLDLLAVFIERLQTGQIADNFPRSSEHTIFQLVRLIEAVFQSPVTGVIN